MTIEDLFSKLKAGRGRGNWGHAGIPGHRGGSAPGVGVSTATSGGDNSFHVSGIGILKVGDIVKYQTKKMSRNRTPPRTGKIQSLPDKDGLVQVSKGENDYTFSYVEDIIGKIS